MCATCGVALSEKPFGCNGTGRIIGGIGAVPGFRWWPIKAYRPCPKLTAAGLQYQVGGWACCGRRVAPCSAPCSALTHPLPSSHATLQRKGQILDEVLFGKGRQ